MSSRPMERELVTPLRTHRGLATMGSECGKKVLDALFDENVGPQIDRMGAIQRRALARGRYPYYGTQDQDLHQEAFGSVNLSHEPWPSCPCDTCEDRRRHELTRTYPSLRGLGMSPRAYGYEMEEVL